MRHRLSRDSLLLFPLAFLTPHPASFPFSQELERAQEKNVLKHTKHGVRNILGSLNLPLLSPGVHLRVCTEIIFKCKFLM